jgi:putative endonuclease
VLARNVWAGGYEIDIVVRRGSRLVFCEVKSKSGDRAGDPLDMVGPGKRRRLRQAAEAWLAAHSDLAGLDASFEVVAVRPRGLERVPLAL